LKLLSLSPGMPPDVVEKLRWETFGHRRSQCLASPEDQVRFTTKRGFVLLFPVSGLRYPSILEATVGRPLLDFIWDERTRSMVQWHTQTLRSHKVALSAVLAGQKCVVSPGFLANFFRLSELPGNEADCLHLQKQGRVGGAVVAIAQALHEHGPLGQQELAKVTGMHQPAAQQRFVQAIADALRFLLVVEVNAVDAEVFPAQPVFDLLPRTFPAVIEKALNTTSEIAREHILCRYLRNVLVEAGHEIARVLGWPEDIVLSTCAKLVRKRHILEHPASRPNRHLFQAVSTDLLENLPDGAETT
jgi:hypothetical protein